MNPEDIGKILDEIGKRIGPAGEHVWQVLIRQVYIEGFLNIAFGVVFLAGAAVFGKVSYSRFVKEKNDRYDDGPVMRGLIWGALSVVGTIIGATALWFGVLYLLNPEYEAISRLLEKIVP